MGRLCAQDVGATNFIDRAKAIFLAPSSGKAQLIAEHRCALHDSSSSRAI
jgi:hypothetical protein